MTAENFLNKNNDLSYKCMFVMLINCINYSILGKQKRDFIVICLNLFKSFIPL